MMEGKRVWGRADCMFNFGHVELEILVRDPMEVLGRFWSSR